MNTKNLVNDITLHVISISEDLDYGAEVTKEQEKKLQDISNFLEELAENVAMQNLVETES